MAPGRARGPANPRRFHQAIMAIGVSKLLQPDEDPYPYPP